MAGRSASASATLDGSTFLPHSCSTVRTVRPIAVARLRQRSEKNPASGTSTSSPGEKTFWTADSRPPVPEEVISSTSARSVRYSSFKRAVTSRIKRPKPGPRWYTRGLPWASSTSGGIGVGPGARMISGLSMPGLLSCPWPFFTAVTAASPAARSVASA